MSDSTEATKQLASLSAQTTVNTIMSSVIIMISLLKPVILEYIQRRYRRRESLAEEMHRPFPTVP
jgi:hypothetical protein